ncbi:MAG: hypothetical protein WD355_12250 [Balneolaceae bacterium]
MVQRELASGVLNDSLFLGYHFGMHKEQFFEHSWSLNQQGIVTGGNQVEYRIDEFTHPAKMTFYPDFHRDRIVRMPVEFSYYSWSPWNRDLFSDSLIVEILDYYEDIYGPGFIRTDHPETGVEAWLKIDGNRRILVFRRDDMRARAEFLDLSAITDD